ncbi:response regulator [Bacillus timonensis]|uniref:response regulator n=1 Tax=Bacillus timonensis TaxID=1033734 RepID=UPI00028819A1|nr:response regulator [Bacillus timonensis]
MRKTVLIADDSLFMRTYLKSLLNREQYIVISEARDGEEAVNKYKEHLPDIVLLDITMPKVSGVDALIEIKKYNPKATVIMCSAMGQKSIIIDSIRKGAKDFIIKPYFNNLVRILNNIEADWDSAKIKA